MSLLRTSELRPNARAHRTRDSVTQGFHYVWSRPDLRATLVMLFLIGTFGLKSRPWRSASSKPMRAALACCLDDGDRNDVGRAAGREPRAAAVHIADAGLCDLRTGCTLAALSPSYWLFAAALVVIGVAALTVTNTSNALMQLSTEPAMRGRVMALRLGIALGGTPIGAPIVGWLADHLGPGWALGVGAAAGFAAAIVAIAFLSQRDVEAGGCRQP